MITSLNNHQVVINSCLDLSFHGKSLTTKTWVWLLCYGSDYTLWCESVITPLLHLHKIHKIECASIQKRDKFHVHGNLRILLIFYHYHHNLITIYFYFYNMLPETQVSILIIIFITNLYFIELFGFKNKLDKIKIISKKLKFKKCVRKPIKLNTFERKIQKYLLNFGSKSNRSLNLLI